MSASPLPCFNSKCKSGMVRLFTGQVICSMCGLAGPYSAHDEEAVDGWNRVADLHRELAEWQMAKDGLAPPNWKQREDAMRKVLTELIADVLFYQKAEMMVVTSDDLVARVVAALKVGG